MTPPLDTNTHTLTHTYSCVAAQFSLTQVLKLLVVLASLHLQVELVLVGAELEQILTGLVAVCLKQVLNPI